VACGSVIRFGPGRKPVCQLRFALARRAAKSVSWSPRKSASKHVSVGATDIGRSKSQDTPLTVVPYTKGRRRPALPGPISSASPQVQDARRLQHVGVTAAIASPINARPPRRPVAHRTKSRSNGPCPLLSSKHAFNRRWLTNRSTGHFAAYGRWASFHSRPTAARRKMPVSSNVSHQPETSANSPVSLRYLLRTHLCASSSKPIVNPRRELRSKAFVNQPPR